MVAFYGHAKIWRPSVTRLFCGYSIIGNASGRPEREDEI